jgi:uncharacterized protein DUF87/type IV secretory system conjugative DNA transfer VirD4/TraG family protein
MQPTHPLTFGTFLKSLGIQLKNSFNAWHIRIPNLLPLVIIALSIYIIVFVIRRAVQLISIIREEKIFLEITPPAFTQKESYTTQQLYLVLHDIGRQLSFFDRFLGLKMLLSFEIVSTKKEGIRYIIRTTSSQKDSVKRAVVSYLPQVRVKEVADYVPQNIDSSQIRIGEFSLKKHFAFPLAKQNVLSKHDPVAYITGMMTQLEPNEIVSLQIVTSPTISEQTNVISNKILRNEDVLKHLRKSQINGGLKVFTWTIDILLKIVHETVWGIVDILTSNPGREKYVYQQAALQQYQRMDNLRPVRVLSTFEQNVITSVQEKIEQPLFETSIRTMVIIKGKEKQYQRLQALRSSLAVFSVPKYQSLAMKYTLPVFYIKKLQLFLFRKRLLSLVSNNSSSLLSASEIADMYHFPFTKITQTENIVKEHSKELPAPLSFKNNPDLDVVFAKNTFGGSETPIGMTEEERVRHMYVIGATGTGKTTMLLSMINQDVNNNKGVCVIDPHGDLAESVLQCVPEERIKDVIYFNPQDISYPIGVNLLELTPGLAEDEALIEKEFISESVISLFRKVFSDSMAGHPHRIEYILRNTIHTAFTVENTTLFTIFELLNNPPFQKSVIQRLTDEHLKNFWKYEFGKAGDFQKVKMVAPVTARIGRFLFSPSARRILEQEKSTINFDDILAQRKILICNLSKGAIGEDTSEVMGIMLLNKIQLAILKRAKLEKKKRIPFFLYVDEFQNFATQSFVQMLSESRKYGLSLTMAEQSTSQQKDKTLVQIVLANAGTVVTFRSANPKDEELLLPQYRPYIAPGEITNLPSFHFYMKKSAIKPEEPFSGITVPVDINSNTEKVQRFIQASRNNYATTYKNKIGVAVKNTSAMNDDTGKITPKIQTKGLLPTKKK